MGYTKTEVDNKWLNKEIPYKGLHVKFRSPSGIVFELQFHTPEGMDIKNQFHPLYEIEQAPNAKGFKKFVARSKQWEISPRYVAPDGILSISNYP